VCDRERGIMLGREPPCVGKRGILLGREPPCVGGRGGRDHAGKRASLVWWEGVPWWPYYPWYIG